MITFIAVESNDSMANTASTSLYHYHYEEFKEHLKAMRTVREWEYTSRFGEVGRAQTSWANNARVVEYFSDIYSDSKEAIQKADLFLRMHDYIARHAAALGNTRMIEQSNPDDLAVDPALLRAVHHLFTSSSRPSSIEPAKVLVLAKAYEQVERASAL